MSLIRGTTPSITFTFDDIDASLISVAYLIMRQAGSKVIEKDITSATIDENTLTWSLTQEESLLLSLTPVEILCDWKLSSGVRGRSEIISCMVEDSGKNEVI